MQPWSRNQPSDPGTIDVPSPGDDVWDVVERAELCLVAGDRAPRATVPAQARVAREDGVIWLIGTLQAYDGAGPCVRVVAEDGMGRQAVLFGTLDRRETKSPEAGNVAAEADVHGAETFCFRPARMEVWRGDRLLASNHLRRSAAVHTLEFGRRTHVKFK